MLADCPVRSGPGRLPGPVRGDCSVRSGARDSVIVNTEHWQSHRAFLNVSRLPGPVRSGETARSGPGLGVIKTNTVTR